MTSLIKEKRTRKRKPPQESEVTLNDILLKVCEYYRINPDDVISRNRTSIVVKARAVYMSIARSFGFHTEEIGILICRDHSTVIHHTRIYNHYLDDRKTWFDPELYSEINNIKRRLTY